MTILNSMRLIRVIPLLLLLVATSCGTKNYKTNGNSVTVAVASGSDSLPSKVRIQVIADRIVRVTSTPDKEFSDRPSLAVLKNAQKQNFVVVETDSTVEVHTNGMRAAVRLSDGTVAFMDAGGNRLTSELQPASFSRISVDGKPGFSTINRFMTDPTEGLYGLGQHQSDQWNYKGQNEELYQYNTKISIPYVISSKGYGIFWDSYSQARFGNPGQYRQLGDVFRLFDKDGHPGGLTGEYYRTVRRWGGFRGGRNGAAVEPERTVEVRREDSICFVNSEMIKLLPALGNEVCYDGYLEAQENGIHKFLLYYAGYVTVSIDDSLVVPERWRTAWNPNSWKFQYDMEAGQRYHLKINWKPDGSTSYCGLSAYAPVSSEESEYLTMWNEMVPESDYYFISGDNMDDVTRGMHQLVGKPAIMPKWAFGYWQSRERYNTQNELVSTLREFRKRGIGIDNIVQDWNYWEDDAWGTHEFDSKRYPDPKAMVDSVHSMNGHIMISVWPKFYSSTEHYKEFESKGWMYTKAVEDSLKDWVGPGYIGSFYDAYSDGARKLFWNQLKDHLYGYGFDAWWMDASEPNIRDCVPMDYWKQLCGPTALGPSTEYLTAYALMNAQAIYEGLKEENPDQRIFQLTRSGFAGLQRYATASWSGDIGTRWEDMRSQITAGLNYSLCGNPYWTMDIGGFCVENRYANAQRIYDNSGIENDDLKEWRELQARWYQFGAFAPLFRAHGQFPLREMWNIAPEGHPAYESMLYYNRLRYRLMPYIYSLAGRAWLRGRVMMRGLVMDWPDDQIAMNVDDQFMLGSSIMVCPVYEYGARERQVYLPSGNVWYDFYDDTRTYDGGQFIMADAPYERIPLYVPSGSMIVTGPEQQYVDEKPYDNLVIDVYGGSDGVFHLYEDDGNSYDYENGAYSMITFQYTENAEGATFVAGPRMGSYNGMPSKREFSVRFHTQNGLVEKEMTYTGDRLEIRL